MEQIVNQVYKPLFIKEGNIRYCILIGGRGAGRSTVASQYALAKLRASDYFRCAIMRYILSDIRNSVYREISDRIDEVNLTDISINDSVMSFEYGQNSINAVGFRKSSGDQKSKLKSLAGYTTVIIEEADEIPEADFMQLDDSLRTTKADITIILLLNAPPKTHWIIRRWFNLEEVAEAKGFYYPTLKPECTDTLVIRSSYLDNIANIAQQTRNNYEAYRVSKPDHYWNMIRGYVPEVVRGKIYTNWKIIDSVPHEARLVRRWLDFGYTNDPTSIGDIYEYNGGYILDELCYQSGMMNHQIASFILGQPEQVTVVADSAEPKSIAEIKLAGVTIIPAEKGKDSVKNGISYVQSKRISVTKRSVNTIFEYDNHAWYEDKDGTRLNEPKPGNDHSMSGLRYALTSLKSPVQEYQKEQVQFMDMRRNQIAKQSAQ